MSPHKKTLNKSLPHPLHHFLWEMWTATVFLFAQSTSIFKLPIPSQNALVTWCFLSIEIFKCMLQTTEKTLAYSNLQNLFIVIVANFEFQSLCSIMCFFFSLISYVTYCNVCNNFETLAIHLCLHCVVSKISTTLDPM